MSSAIKGSAGALTGADLLRDQLQTGAAAKLKGSGSSSPATETGSSVAFRDLLANEFDRGAVTKSATTALPAASSELKFSAHAKARLNSRGIDLTADDLLKMQEAVKKAGDKGSKESLILTDKGAFVVSVKNNTVITAVDKQSLKENVFTNIDSTVWI